MKKFKIILLCGVIIGLLFSLTSCGGISFKINGKEITKQDNTTLVTPEPTDEPTDEPTTEPTDEPITEPIVEPIVTPDDVVWKETSEDSPAQIGEFVKVMDYNPAVEDDKNQYLGIRIDKVITGEEASNITKEYLDSNEYSIYKYEELEDGRSYMVIDFTVDYSQWTIPDYGKSNDFSSLDVRTKGETFLYDKDKSTYLIMNPTITVYDWSEDVEQGDRFGTCRVITTTFTNPLDPQLVIGYKDECKGYVAL